MEAHAHFLRGLLGLQPTNPNHQSTNGLLQRKENKRKSQTTDGTWKYVLSTRCILSSTRIDGVAELDSLFQQHARDTWNLSKSIATHKFYEAWGNQQGDEEFTRPVKNLSQGHVSRRGSICVLLGRIQTLDR